MNPVPVESEKFILPPGTVARTIGGPQNGQPQYIGLPAQCTPGGYVLSQWRPDADELRRLNAGEPVTLVLGTFGRGYPPTILAVGGLDLSER